MSAPLDDIAHLVQLEEDLRAQRTQIAEELAEIQALIKEKMGSSTVGTLAGIPMFKHYSRPTKRLNILRLRDEKPDIAEQYTEVRTEQRFERVIPE